MEKPLIFTPHAHPFYTLNHPFLNKIFIKRIIKKANKIISINKEDFNFFSKYNNNVVTIPHWYGKDAMSNMTQKNKLSKPVILFVGRNNANKNLSLLYSLPKDKYQVICVTNTKPEREDFIFKNRISDEELSSYIKMHL